MSGSSAGPKKLSRTKKLVQLIIRPRSRASSPSPASSSTQVLTSSTVQSPALPPTQILPPSSPPSAQPAAPHHANASAASSLPTSSSNKILEDALQRLSERERATLREYIPPTSDDIDSALEQALAAATEKQRSCIEKRWIFTFAGQKVALKENADKVVLWLNRFKAVGDIAVSADPIHAGLPWAGIRFLLEAAVSEANQMACLLAGCETALYMANRLKVYMEFLLRLPVAPTRTNFEGALTRLYACILRFLSRAIQVYQTQALGRLFKAFWQDDEIQKFEKECDELANRVETEARNCDRTEKLRQDLQELENLRQIQASLYHIETKLDLDKLPCASGAMFGSHGVGHKTCHPATRIALLDQIRDWAQQPRNKSIFWLSGMAGTGKSTISLTIAEWLVDKGQGDLNIDLGASFFFKRGEGDRGNASRFFSTITQQLVLKIPGLRGPVAEAIAHDPFISHKALGEQFDRLIFRPLMAVPPGSYPILVLVVDALDECEREDDIKTILKLWSRLPEITTIRLKLFLTSRPDLPIRLGFKSMSGNSYHDVVLQNAVPRASIQHDISVFLEDSFSKVRQDYNIDPLDGRSLNHDWPGEKVLEDLVNMAIPLFIVAATVYLFVSDPNWDPREQLEKILKFQGIGEQMEQTYLPVLTQSTLTPRNPSDAKRLYEEFRMIVGSIVTLVEPLSKASLAVLLKVPPTTVELRLRPLYSVLQVPDDPDSPIRTLHLSFREFLLSENLRDKPFGVDGPATHRLLLTKCLQLLSKGLRENICDLQYPGQLRQEVERSIINERLTPALQYACRYWVYHAQGSKVRIQDNDKVHEFLQQHFLHWLEALSLMDRVTEVIKYIGILKSLVSENESKQLSAFLEDARRIILAHRYIIDLAPLQIYSSAIVFAPQTSIVRKVCGQIPTWMQRCPITLEEWSADLQKLEGHTGSVTAVAFSPDGSLLASGSGDGTIRLWNPSTGQELQKLEGHTGSVTAVAFSPDGSLLASGSGDGTIRLWDTATGVQTLKINVTVQELCFSSDGQSLITDRGQLDLSRSGAGIYVDEAWVVQGMQRILWLPVDYRATCVAVRGHLLVMGHASGHISMLEIDAAEHTV